MAEPAQRSSFATTQWSLVLAAQGRAAPEAVEALEAICQIYWYPLYAYVRRRGHDVHDAQDLTQEFLTRLLEKSALGSVDRAKGKFRSFLLAACQHFLAHEHERSQAQKRGGGRTFVALDFADGEKRFSHEPSHELTADNLFERRWAIALLDRVLGLLQ